MTKDNHINYVEFYAGNLTTIKAFYSNCFGWIFTDFGENYTSFSSSGIEGGFELSDKPILNGALIKQFCRAQQPQKRCDYELIQNFLREQNNELFCRYYQIHLPRHEQHLQQT